MAASSTQLSAILKERYEGPIREQINLEALIYQLFEEGPHQWDGDSVRIPLHIGGVDAGAIAYLTESVVGAAPVGPYVPMPIASSQKNGKMNVDAKHLYASFEVTGQAEAKAPGAAGGSEGAFVGAMFSEMRGLEKDIRSSMNKDVFTGQGIDGFLVDGGQVGTGVGHAVLVGRAVSGANHLVSGAYYRCWHVPRDPLVSWKPLDDGGGVNFVFNLTALDATLGTCTLTSTGGAGPDAADVLIQDTDLIAMERVTAFANLARPEVAQINGLNSLAFGALTDDAYGNARDTLNNTVLRGFGYKSDVAGAPGGGKSSGQSLALEDMQLLVDGIEDLTEEDIDTVIMNRFTRAQFRNLTQDGSRYLPGETSANIGHKAGSLMFEDIPITVSKDAPYGAIYFLVSDTINTYTLKPGGFQRFTDGGDVITQKRDANGLLLDVREGFWKQYFNLVSELPRAIGVMAGIKYKRA